MKQKLKVITGALIICIAMSQMTGCINPKNFIAFTGRWKIERDAEGKEISRTCEKGGNQCIVSSTGLAVDLTNDILALLSK